jgi:glycosyltransferase involved in cell wall biosynthesis
VQRVKDGVGSTEDHELLTRLYEAGGRMLYQPRLLVRAGVQPERYARAYHRRWHFGHGVFHARMRTPGMERSRAAIAGIPAHLWRAALRDLGEIFAAVPGGDRDRAFAAELRLRFFVGFTVSRLRGRSSRVDAAPEPQPQAAVSLAHDSATSALPNANTADSTPAVSVVIPCYNQAHFLEEAIRSADLARGAVEIIVVDDGSLDATAEVASGFPHVVYVRQPNQGLAAARNRGLREARGNLIVFLDADDRLLPGGLDRGREALDAHPECAMVFGRCVMMGPDGAFWPTPGQPRIASHHHLAFLRRNPIWMPAMAMFRRDAVRRAGGFAAGFDAAADYDLYLRLSRESPVHDHAQAVAAYRRHGGNMSGNATRMLVETQAVMRRHRPSRDPERLSAWRDGCREWRDFYGTQLVEEIRAHRRRGERGAVLRKGLTLMRRNPGMAGREIAKKVRLHDAALPMFASKTKS